MKLYYFRATNGKKNFGDDLNPWLWEKLLPGILDDHQDVAFVGIGTLLNDRLAQRTHHARQKIVFGTGVGYGTGLPEIDASYKIYCVRGPHSAKALGISEDLAVTDGAVLLRQIFPYHAPKTYRFAFMPHHKLAGKDWEVICQTLGIAYIDPGWSLEKVLSMISQTEILLAEAMHGAIVADAFRVPWIPIVTNPDILPFKWQDWCASIGVDYQPTHIKCPLPQSKYQTLRTSIRSLQRWTRQQEICRALRRIMQQHSPVLSQDTRIESLTQQLDDRLQQFKQDVAAGLFVEHCARSRI